MSRSKNKTLAVLLLVTVFAFFGWALWAEFGPCLFCGSTGKVQISIASSITKTEWLNNAVAEFNEKSKNESQYQVDGKRIEVEILLENDPLSGSPRHWNSPTQVTATLDGRIQPTILSPATVTWIEHLNEQWLARPENGGRAISTQPAQSVLSTPVVIAMWEERARLLGCWPEVQSTCTWDRVRQLAIDPEGWGTYGQGSWGKFKFGYAYVGESDVGTQTAALICMAGFGRTTGVVEADIRPDNECGDALRDVEKVIGHRGTSSPLILRAMLEGGPSFLDAVTTYEKNVIIFNQQNPNSPWGKLVAVYPHDGTVVADHVFAIMDNAPWVTVDQVEAAKKLEQYLLSPDQQNRLGDTGLRPTDGTVPQNTLIREEFGARPNTDYTVLNTPSLGIINQVIEVWTRVKRPANVVLVFDKSASMNDQGRLGAAIAGSVRFVDELKGNDWLSWLPFDDEVYPPVSGLKGAVAEELKSTIRNTPASGSTALYDAVAEALDIIDEQQAINGIGARYGIVVLSDGMDSGVGITLGELETRLRNSSPEGGIPVEVHAIGVGDGASDFVLTAIAHATHGGRYWKVNDAETLEEVYKRISKYW